MKKNLRWMVVIGLAVGICLAFGPSLWAQAVRGAKVPTPPIKGPGVAGKAGEVVRLRKLNGIGKHCLIRTPEYRTNIGAGGGDPKEWHQIQVTYDVFPEWIDELTFVFYAMSDPMLIDGKKVYSYYKTTARYVDIEKGQMRSCAAYLRPSAVKRFGEITAVAVEVIYKEQVVDVLSECPKKYPANWWKNPVITESPDVVVRDGYLVNKSLSPFALIVTEGYEWIR